MATGLLAPVDAMGATDMLTRAVFYGRLRDRVGASEVALPLTARLSIDDFRALLASEDSDLLIDLSASSIRIAVNDVMAARGEVFFVSPGDEVAFMPPFSGG